MLHSVGRALLVQILRILVIDHTSSTAPESAILNYPSLIDVRCRIPCALLPVPRGGLIDSALPATPTLEEDLIWLACDRRQQITGLGGRRQGQQDKEYSTKRSTVNLVIACGSDGLIHHLSSTDVPTTILPSNRKRCVSPPDYLATICLSLEVNLASL